MLAGPLFFFGVKVGLELFDGSGTSVTLRDVTWHLIYHRSHFGSRYHIDLTQCRSLFHVHFKSHEANVSFFVLLDSSSRKSGRNCRYRGPAFGLGLSVFLTLWSAILRLFHAQVVRILM